MLSSRKILVYLILFIYFLSYSLLSLFFSLMTDPFFSVLTEFLSLIVLCATCFICLISAANQFLSGYNKSGPNWFRIFLCWSYERPHKPAALVLNTKKWIWSSNILYFTLHILYHKNTSSRDMKDSNHRCMSVEAHWVILNDLAFCFLLVSVLWHPWLPGLVGKPLV